MLSVRSLQQVIADNILKLHENINYLTEKFEEPRKGGEGMFEAGTGVSE